MAIVSALYVYPIKACRGIRVTEWPIAERGFASDRRWMVVDAAGTFVSQREVPLLALVTVRIDGASLIVTAPGLEPLILPSEHEVVSEARAVQIWSDEALACVHQEGSRWFSAFLGSPCELVYMPDTVRRPVNPARSLASDIVSFADGYPFLLISEASLAALNERLATPVVMERFRPNIVISGTPAFAEDDYARVRIGEISFRGTKRCDRCVVTTVDPETGEVGKEPLRTLAKFRLEDSRVWFGMNLIHDGQGVLRVGDVVA